MIANRKIIYIADNTVYLAADRKTAVKEGDPKAAFLLVRKGQEIVASEVEKYDGALGLIGDKQEKPAKSESSAAGGPTPENREDAMPSLRTRDNGGKKK